MTFDPILQRRIMGHFATGVTIVTTCYGSPDQVWGMTANSLTSLSLNPPLMLVTVDQRNQMREFMAQGKCFAVSILSLDQEAVSRRFATRGPKDFAGLNIKIAETGAPILVGALAYVDCRVVQIVPAGDHDIFIGEIVAGDVHDGRPLLFFNGHYSKLALHGASDLTLGPETLDDTYTHYGSF